MPSTATDCGYSTDNPGLVFTFYRQLCRLGLLNVILQNFQGYIGYPNYRNTLHWNIKIRTFDME